MVRAPQHSVNAGSSTTKHVELVDLKATLIELSGAAASANQGGTGVPVTACDPLMIVRDDADCTDGLSFASTLASASELNPSGSQTSFFQYPRTYQDNSYMGYSVVYDSDGSIVDIPAGEHHYSEWRLFNATSNLADWTNPPFATELYDVTADPEENNLLTATAPSSLLNALSQILETHFAVPLAPVAMPTATAVPTPTSSTATTLPSDLPLSCVDLHLTSGGTLMIARATFLFIKCLYNVII